MVVKGLYDPAEKKRESGKGNRLGGRPKGSKNKPKNIYKEPTGRRKQNKPRGLKGTKTRAQRVSRPTKSSGRRGEVNRGSRADQIREGQTNEGKNFNFKYARDLTETQVEKIISEAIKRKKGAGRPSANTLQSSGIRDASQFRNQQRISQDILGKNMSLSRDPLQARRGFTRYNQEPTGRSTGTEKQAGGLRGGYGLNPSTDQRIRDQPISLDRYRDPIVDLIERLETGGLSDRNIVITREELPETNRNRRTYSARTNTRIEIEDPIKTGLRNIAEAKVEAEKLRLSGQRVQEAVGKEKVRRSDIRAKLEVSKQNARNKARENNKSNVPYLPPDTIRGRLSTKPIYSAPDRRSRTKSYTFFDDAASTSSSGETATEKAQQRVNKRKSEKKFQDVKGEIFAKYLGDPADFTPEPSLLTELGITGLGSKLRDFVRRPQSAPPSVATILEREKKRKETQGDVDDLLKEADRQDKQKRKDAQSTIDRILKEANDKVKAKQRVPPVNSRYITSAPPPSSGPPAQVRRSPAPQPEPEPADISGAESLLELSEGTYEPSLDAVYTGRGATEGILQGAFSRIGDRFGSDIVQDEDVGIATGEPIPRTEPDPVSEDRTLQRELEVRRKATELEIRRKQEQANRDALARANRDRRNRQADKNVSEVVREVNRRSVRDNLKVVAPPDIVIQEDPIITAEREAQRKRDTENKIDTEQSKRYGPQFSTPDNEQELMGIQDRERTLKLGLKKKYGIKAGFLNMGRFPRETAPALILADLYELDSVQKMTAQEQIDLSEVIKELETLHARRKQLENKRKKSKGGKKKKK